MAQALSTRIRRSIDILWRGAGTTGAPRSAGWSVGYATGCAAVRRLPRGKKPSLRVPRVG